MTSIASATKTPFENYLDSIEILNNPKFPYKAQHSSDGKIEIYKEETLMSLGSCTLMEFPGTEQRFVLTADHVVKEFNQPGYTGRVSFKNKKDGPEKFFEIKEIKSFQESTTPPSLTKLLKMTWRGEYKWEELSELNNHYYTDIAVVLLKQYPDSIPPASFEEEPISKDGILCTLSGYGEIVSSHSTNGRICYLNNEFSPQSLVQLPTIRKVEPNKKLYRELGIKQPSGEGFISVFNGQYSSDPGKKFERPLSYGFSGSSLRNEKGKVIAVLAEIDPGINKFRACNTPYAKVGQYLKNKAINHSVFTSLALAYLIYGLVRLDFNPFDEPVGVIPQHLINLAIYWLVSFAPLSQAYNDYSHNLPKGTEGYFAGTQPWLGEIKEFLDKHYPLDKQQ